MKNLRNLIKRPERGKPGYYASIIVNTKGEGFPLYFAEYLCHLAKKLLYGFSVDTVFNLTDQTETWSKAYPELVEEGDTIFQIVLKFDITSTEEEVEIYLDEILDEYLLSFMIGCGFFYLTTSYHYSLSDEYLGLDISGKEDLIIENNGSSIALLGIVNNVFNFTEDEVTYMETCLKNNGWFRFPHKIDKFKAKEVLELFKELRIKYEIT